MEWYGLKKGPLKALKALLDAPLEFDPLEYIERTFEPDYSGAHPDVVRLATLYNDMKVDLRSKAIGLVRMLEESSKLSLDNMQGESLALQHTFESGTLSPEQLAIPMKIKSCDSINMQLDRMLEEFKVTNCQNGRFKGDELSEFIAFYQFSEVMFFVLGGMAVVEFSAEGAKVRPANEQVIKQLHRKWFANYWEQMSAVSSLACFDWAPKGLEGSPEFIELISLFGRGFRDKIFSIPNVDLPGRLARLESIQWIDKICNLTALIMWCQIKNGMQQAPYDLLEKIGWSRADVERLSGYLQRYAQPDRVFAINSKGVRIDNPSFTIQLRAIINDIANVISEGRLNQLLGDYFEKDYVAKFFEGSDLCENYRVHPGILAHELQGGSLKADVDFVVEDIRRNKFFFVQVKYLRVGGKSYISGDLDHVLSGKLSDGLKQLLGVKQALEEGKLKECLGRKGLAACNESNAVFMLIHNVTNFDFCIWPSGIVSYEWNSIRNLFKDGEVTYGHSRSAPQTWKNGKPSAIETPDELINLFMNQGPHAQLGGASKLFETDHVSVAFRAKEQWISCIGMGL